jgi:hypothetical protein
MSFLAMESARLTVDRTAGRSEEHASTNNARRLEQIDCSDDIHLSVIARIRDGFPHIDLRGKMADQLGPNLRDQRGQPGLVQHTLLV